MYIVHISRTYLILIIIKKLYNAVINFYFKLTTLTSIDISYIFVLQLTFDAIFINLTVNIKSVFVIKFYYRKIIDQNFVVCVYN